VRLCEVPLELLPYLVIGSKVFPFIAVILVEARLADNVDNISQYLGVGVGIGHGREFDVCFNAFEEYFDGLVWIPYLPEGDVVEEQCLRSHLGVVHSHRCVPRWPWGSSTNIRCTCYGFCRCRRW
jgi:hypothetical protein